ncbi:MAG TPA: hypothetical protein PKH93_10890 [Chitinophagales bacterium]|nr:hypothetical protein [Chitinophagales bacterium]
MPRYNYAIDFDNNWKEVVSAMFIDFLAFFMPRLYADADLTREPTFLEQEFYELLQPENNEQTLDKLAKVFLKSGEEKWVYVHIEFQTAAESHFARRMYNYYQVIRSKYGKDMTAIVIYTGKHRPRRYNCYQEEHYGTLISYRFNTYSVIQQDEAELLANPNPFAIVVLANYYVLKTKANDPERLSFKEQVFKLASERGYDYPKTNSLLLFIYELMKLSKPLSQDFYENIIQPSKHIPAMIKYSRATRDIIDYEVKQVYGFTITELQAKQAKSEAKAEQSEAKVELLKVEAEAKIKQAEAEAEQSKAQAEQIMRKSILTFYTHLQLPIFQIAEKLGLSEELVRNTLISEKIILS